MAVGVAQVTQRFLRCPEALWVVIVCLISYGAAAFCLSVGRFDWLSFVLAIVLWILGEHPAHRYLLHMKRPRSAFGRRLIARLHYDHHRDPSNAQLLFLPFWVSAPLLALGLTLPWVVRGDWAAGVSFLTGLSSVLVYYEWMHFAMHQRLHLNNRFYKHVFDGHMRHHYMNERYWFGVSNPVGDWLWSTYPSVDVVEKSKTARDLEASESAYGESDNGLLDA